VVYIVSITSGSFEETRTLPLALTPPGTSSVAKTKVHK